MSLSLPAAVGIFAVAIANSGLSTSSSTPEPIKVSAAAAPVMTSITVDPDYEINVWADQSIFTPLGVAFNTPRAITFDDSGGAYVSVRGTIWYLEDRLGDCDPTMTRPCQLTVPDGVADPNPTLVIDNTGSILGMGPYAGLLWHQGALYASRGIANPNDPPTHSHNEILKFVDLDADGVVDDADNDGVLEAADVLITTDATDFGHTIGALLATPDGTRILVSKGSYQNTSLGPFGADPCSSALTCSASLLAFDLDGSNLTVFAEGVRNTVEPQFGIDDQLFGADNGPNGTGTSPPEEINHIIEGRDYGFPSMLAGGPQPVGATPIGFLDAHVSPAGSAAYSYPELVQFPGQRDQIFQSLYGAFNPALMSPLGQSVLRLNIAETSPGQYAATPELPPDLITGATNAFAYGFEHPVDVTTNRRGDLFIVDMQDDGYAPFDNTGVIYRVIYKDLEIPVPDIIVEQDFDIILRGSPFAYYRLFITVDPDPNYSLDFGLNARNGTSTLSASVQVKMGILNASGKRTITAKVMLPAPGLVGHEIRFQLFRVDFDPVTQSFPINDFFIGRDETKMILAQ